MPYDIRNVLAVSELSISNAHYLNVTADLGTSTWNTAASHEVFTVTGPVRMRMWVQCTENVASSGGTATIAFGHETTTNAFIAATDETELDAGDLWYDTTPTTSADTLANVVLDWVINGLDVGYIIANEALTDGTLVFHCVWDALASGASVAAGAGGTL